MAAVPIIFGIGAAVSAGSKVLGGLSRAKAALAEGQARQQAAIENAKRLEDKAKFTELKTEEEIVRFGRIRDDVNATVRAETGGAGLKLTGSALAIITSNTINTARDVDIVRTAGAREASALRSDAQTIREQGATALTNAELAARAERLGGVFGGIGTIGAAFGDRLISRSPSRLRRTA